MDGWLNSGVGQPTCVASLHNPPQKNKKKKETLSFQPKSMGLIAR